MTPSANYVELIRKLRRTFVKTALAQRLCGSWSKQWLGLSTLNQINMPGSLHKYWRKCRAKIERNQRRSFDGIMIYFWWNILKEWIEGFFNRRIYNLDKWQCYARMTYNVFYHQLMVWNEHREVLFQDCIWSTSFFEKTWNTKHKIAYLCFFLSLYQRWIWAHFRSKNRGKPKQRSMVFYIDTQQHN